MSTEFRQRSPGEYAKILWRRKWAILLPTFAISVAVAAVVIRLPNVYQSTTLLTVRPSTLSKGIVPQLPADDLTIRINNIAQEVFSRSSLEPLIVTYDLYAQERKRGEPMESLVEVMRKRDIRVDLNNSRNDITNGFQISFRGPDANVVQRVTSDLAGKYVSAQTKVSSESALLTQEFMAKQVEAARAALDAVDLKRLEFQRSNMTHLPTASGALMQQLSGLYEQQKSLIAEIGRLHDQQTILNTQLGSAEKDAQDAIDDLSETITDPKTTAPWSDLASRESQFEAEIQAMISAGLRPKNPEVVAKKQELAVIQRRKQQMLDEWKDKIAEKKSRLERRENPSLRNGRLQLEYLQKEIGRQEKALDETRTAISTLTGRLDKVPEAEIGLSELDREYATKKAAYDALLAGKQGADLGAAVSTSAQGETIQVIDPASHPELPVAPKRPMLYALGLAFGLGVGLLLAVASEIPQLLTIQTVEDARHYTSLPVLVSVPELLTPREERHRKVRRAALALASVAATVVSAPALALLLKLTHVLERFGA
ncbi:MAG TPA: GNVR domain-containing protein [Pyrinomonadaceae bacterium]|nr:GNVR domain-containing protein [Pyrinomonadaceae bacterium]